MKKIIFIIIGFAVFLLIYMRINRESYINVVDSNNNIKVDFIISKGGGSTKVGQDLEKEGFIKSKYYFWYYVWRTKTDTKLQAGTYSLSKNMSIPQMVELFVNGKIKDDKIKLTIPEGSNNNKIIEILRDKKPSLADEFKEIVKCKCLNQPNCFCDKFSGKYNFIKNISQGIDLEGYLFPDTYFISESETGTTLVSKLLNNFENKICGDLKKEILSQDKTIHEIITLASIVEREAREDKDRPVVAGIFFNRLETGHPLQSDATLSYILGTDKIKYYQDDIDKESPYNTYKNIGLPPGPISNPGLEAIMATTHPTETDYFYFLNDANTGETIFARTFEEHKKNKANHGL
jgi:UPF0755 protein